MQQWIRLGQVELLDTPGVLWPKLDNPHVAHILAITAPSNRTFWTRNRYLRTSVCGVRRIILRCCTTGTTCRYCRQHRGPMSLRVWGEVEPLLEAIGKKRGMVRGGGVADTERAAELVLRELQTGKLGRVTLEWPGEEHLLKSSDGG